MEVEGFTAQQAARPPQGSCCDSLKGESESGPRTWPAARAHVCRVVAALSLTPPLPSISSSLPRPSLVIILVISVASRPAWWRMAERPKDGRWRISEAGWAPEQRYRNGRKVGGEPETPIRNALAATGGPRGDARRGGGGMAQQEAG